MKAGQIYLLLFLFTAFHCQVFSFGHTQGLRRFLEAHRSAEQDAALASEESKKGPQDPKEQIGMIMALDGESKIINQVIGQREAKLRGALFRDDIIMTGPRSIIKVSFLDGSVFRLAGNTELRVNNFVFEEPDGGQDPSLGVNIPRGTFSFLVGKIARKNPKAVKVTTPTVSIGIRGSGGSVRIHPVNGEVEVQTIPGHVLDLETLNGERLVLQDPQMGVRVRGLEETQFYYSAGSLYDLAIKYQELNSLGENSSSNAISYRPTPMLFDFVPSMRSPSLGFIPFTKRMPISLFYERGVALFRAARRASERSFGGLEAISLSTAEEEHEEFHDFGDGLLEEKRLESTSVDKEASSAMAILRRMSSEYLESMKEREKSSSQLSSQKDQD